MSLLVIVLLVVHIVTSVLDGFAPIGLIDAVVPLASKYRPLWMGLGALSFDLLLALAATSLMRRRVGYRDLAGDPLARLCSWPVAVLHGLGTGSDTKAGWMLALTAVCVAAVLGAVATPDRAGRIVRAGGCPPPLLARASTPVGLVAFAAAGPLQPGWARRAGTPANLLAGSTSAAPGPGCAGVPPVSTRRRGRLGGATGLEPRAVARQAAGKVDPDAGAGRGDRRPRTAGQRRRAGNLRVRMAGAPIERRRPVA